MGSHSSLLCYPAYVNWQSDSASSGSAKPNSSAEQGLLGIGTVCEQTGLSPRTVRYYEELGLLPGVRRRSGGRRVYGSDELERLRFIQRLKTFGLALSEIKELNTLYALEGSTAAMLKRLDDLLIAHISELDGRIAALAALRDEMGSYREHVAARVSAPAGPSASDKREPGDPT
jgi:DNA-binding transcriptional MerR regulator